MVFRIKTEKDEILSYERFMFGSQMQIQMAIDASTGWFCMYKCDENTWRGITAC